MQAHSEVEGARPTVTLSMAPDAPKRDRTEASVASVEMPRTTTVRAVLAVLRGQTQKS